MSKPTLTLRSGVQRVNEPEFTAILGIMRECADALDAAATTRIGHMDSDSRVAEINARRIADIQAVAAKLRKAAQA